MKKLILLAVLCGCGSKVSPPSLPPSKWIELSPYVESNGWVSGSLSCYEDKERGYIVYSTVHGVVAVPMLPKHAEEPAK